MTVRLYEWDKTETGWAWIEITDNKVVNLKLRDENNLIKINEDDEAYVDLQLDDGIEPWDDLPVGVETWRVLVADGRPVNGTLILAKTTSWDEIQLLYWDDWKIYADNGTWTFKTLGRTTAYFKTQAEYNALPQSKESDNNLYIIVDTHKKLLEYAELILLTPDEIVEELNSASQEYINKYSNENHMSYSYDRYTLMEDATNAISTYVNNYIFSTNEWTIVWEKRSK